jgi:hypothetical protein
VRKLLITGTMLVMALLSHPASASELEGGLGGISSRPAATTRLFPHPSRPTSIRPLTVGPASPSVDNPWLWRGR